jgi:hypothetical protein
LASALSLILSSKEYILLLPRRRPVVRLATQKWINTRA